MTQGPSPAYARYHLEGAPAPDLTRLPPRFRVRVKRARLAWLLTRELFRYKFNLKVVFSRPCVYGVFSGPIGGFAPRPRLCVGCLRCTTQYPDIVQIHRNPDRKALGDAYFTSGLVEAVTYEAETGRVPVKGAGFRGPFSGPGWDGMWTDMSEIVRPTRDGIHGREYISTSVDIGTRPSYLRFDGTGSPVEPPPPAISLPVPFLFDAPPALDTPLSVQTALVEAARRTRTLAIVPAPHLQTLDETTVPLVDPADPNPLESKSGTPRLVELAQWDPRLHDWIRTRYPRAQASIRVPLGVGQAETLRTAYDGGARIFHLTADLHGRGTDGRFVADLIRDAHRQFVDLAVRDEVTLVGSGGIVAAEHVPKAIIVGLDAVALDTTPLFALQASPAGPIQDRSQARFGFHDVPLDWGAQRLVNLLASWRDQLLEVLGAMGLREVRRLRGEIGRAMFQADLEREAFGDLHGYAPLA